MWVAIAAITGWAVLTLYRMHVAGRAREQAHRERLAMIEKGLVPPPEADPGQFERMMDWHPSRPWEPDRYRDSLRTGIILIGVGVGLATMLYLMNAGGAMGVGALLIVMGAAFLVIAMFEVRSPREQGPRTPTDASGS